MKYILYIDEAGCPGKLPNAYSNVQPIFCLTGLIIPVNMVVDLTHGFLDLQRKYNPDLAEQLSHDLDMIRKEVKGSDLRSQIKGRRNPRRRAFGMLDEMFRLLENNGCRILARGYIKKPGAAFDGVSVYTTSVQIFCKHFQTFLQETDSMGLVVADSRRQGQNSQVSYSIFTKKFQQRGDAYPNLIEMPVFGHCQNHVGLQISDWIASAILFPAMSHVYCADHITSVHVHDRFEDIKERYKGRLKRLQYRYQISGIYTGGIQVIDGIEKRRSAALLFC